MSSAGTADAVAGRAPTVHLVRANAVQIAVAALLLGGAAVVLVADRWLMAALLALSPIAAAVSVVDARTKRVPTRLAVAAAAVGVLGFGVAAASIGAPATYARALVAGVAAGAFYVALWRFMGVGAGDVRLAAALGIFAGWSGWSTVVGFVVLAHLLVLPLALGRLARKRRDDLPFGPAMVVGLYLAITLAGLTA